MGERRETKALIRPLWFLWFLWLLMGDQSDSGSFMRLKERLDTEMARYREREAAAKKKSKGKGKGAAHEEEDDGDPIIKFEEVGNDPACLLQIVGNNICASVEDVERFNEEQTVNTLVLTLRKGRTVSGCIDLCAKAQSSGWAVCCATENNLSEAAETSDDFIAHLAVGVKAGQFR